MSVLQQDDRLLNIFIVAYLDSKPSLVQSRWRMFSYHLFIDSSKSAVLEVRFFNIPLLLMCLRLCSVICF
jgi:hypothetical protein